jgi:hypothetical protein
VRLVTRGLLLGVLIGCGCAAGASAAVPKRITFYFGLARPEARAQAAFFAVQRPGSATYRRFLSPAGVAARYGASPAVRSAFIRDARRLGFSVRIDPTGVFARVTGTVRRFERAFKSCGASGRRFISPSRPRRPPGAGTRSAPRAIAPTRGICASCC